MALYTDVCTVVRIDAGQIERFEVRIDLHQSSVLNPLLFAVVMDVDAGEERSCLQLPIIQQITNMIANDRKATLQAIHTDAVNIAVIRHFTTVERQWYRQQTDGTKHLPRGAQRQSSGHSGVQDHGKIEKSKHPELDPSTT